MKVLLAGLSLVLFSLPAIASDAATTPIYLQAWIGALDTDSESAAIGKTVVTKEEAEAARRRNATYSRL